MDRRMGVCVLYAHGRVCVWGRGDWWWCDLISQVGVRCRHKHVRAHTHTHTEKSTNLAKKPQKQINQKSIKVNDVACDAMRWGASINSMEDASQSLHQYHIWWWKKKNDFCKERPLKVSLADWVAWFAVDAGRGCGDLQLNHMLWMGVSVSHTWRAWCENIFTFASSRGAAVVCHPQWFMQSRQTPNATHSHT